MAVGKTELQILVNAKDNASKGLGKATKALGALGIAAAAVGVASVKMAADFDKGMREVATLTPDVADNLDAMKSDVLELSRTLGVDAVEATGALYQAISAGVPADNAISFLEIASKAAIGGVTDTETAVDGLSTVMNAFASQNIDAQRAADVMFATVKAGKTDFSQLSASMFQVAPLANAAGVSFEEVSAGLATLTAQGTPTTVATTQLRAAIQGLTKPSDELTAIFQDAGFASGELAVQQLGLSGAADVVTKATGGSLASMTKLLGSIEGVQAILGITGDNAASFAKNVDGMSKAGGAANAAFEEMEKSTSRNFAKMKAQAQVLMIQIGEKLLPVINKLLEFLLGLEGPAKTVAIVLGGIAAALGVLMAVLGPLLALKGFVVMAVGFTKVGVVLPTLVVGVKLLAGALLALLGPVGLVIAGVALLGIGIKLAGDHFGWWGDKAETAAVGAYKLDDAVTELANADYELTKAQDTAAKSAEGLTTADHEMAGGLAKVIQETAFVTVSLEQLRIKTDEANAAMFNLTDAGIDPAGVGMGLTRIQAGELRLAIANLAEEDRLAEEATLALTEATRLAEEAERLRFDVMKNGISVLEGFRFETASVTEALNILATETSPTLDQELLIVQDALIATGMAAKEAARMVSDMRDEIDRATHTIEIGTSPMEIWAQETRQAETAVKEVKTELVRAERATVNYTRAVEDAAGETRNLDRATSDVERAMRLLRLEEDQLTELFTDLQVTGVEPLLEGFDLLEDSMKRWGEEAVAAGKVTGAELDILMGKVAAHRTAADAAAAAALATAAVVTTAVITTTPPPDIPLPPDTPLPTAVPSTGAITSLQEAQAILEKRLKRQEEFAVPINYAFERAKGKAQLEALTASERQRFAEGTLAGVSFGQGAVFQRGGSFTVPGSGGPDSQNISFMATPGERVSVTRPNQASGVHQTIIVRGSVISERELGTLAVRAMRNATRLNQSVLNVNQVVA
jgi:TP901 family phage tail tape measure protein